jgi:hypothetical protein
VTDPVRRQGRHDGAEPEPEGHGAEDRSEPGDHGHLDRENAGPVRGGEQDRDDGPVPELAARGEDAQDEHDHGSDRAELEHLVGGRVGAQAR